MAADAGAQITELKADDHTCLTSGEAEEIFDLTAAYVRDVLADGSKVMWLSDDAQGPAAADRAADRADTGGQAGRIRGIAGRGGHELGAVAGDRGRAAPGVRAEIDGRAGRRDRIGAVPL